MRHLPELVFVAVVVLSICTMGCSDYQATKWVTGILATIGSVACLWLIGSKNDG